MAEAETPHEFVACSDEATDRVVAGLRISSPQAHAELYAQFGQEIQEFAARRLREVELAEDTMVQTLVSAARHIARFNPRISTFRAWLFGIARRQIQHEARLRARRRLVPTAAQVPLDQAAKEAATSDLAADLAARLDAQRQVAALEANLSQVELDVLILWAVYEFSLREIGQVVGRSERAINSLLGRAKHKARGLLASGETCPPGAER